MSVAVHAVRRAEVTAKDTAVVIGLGTIGMFVVTQLLARGVQNITVVVNKEFQRKMALELGVSVKNYQDAGEEKISGDVVFECVGRQESAVLAIKVAATSGRVVMVGNPYSDMAFPRNTYWKILRSQLSVLGTWNSSFTKEITDDWHTALDLLREKQDLVSKIITHRLPLEELETGLRIMRDKTEGYGKIMIVGRRDQ